jgi:arylsulfatase A-like enzyme/Flp pilus assembly protein TadD
MTARIAQALASLPLAALLAACGAAPEPAAGPNLLLITVDTLRADRLGAYGHAAAATPHLDRLAAEGVRFDQAATVAPLTLPAHVSILTGRYPFRHGVRDNLNYALPSEASTLPEVLAAAGYATGGFVGAYVLRAKTGIAQGFDNYTDFEPAARGSDLAVGHEIERPAAAVVADALAWIGGRSGPFFAWVHLFDPHLPYAPPPPFEELYRGAPYDGEIAYVDEAVGVLLRGLAERGHGGDTLVVVAADHGEGLGDHGEERHAFLLYDETVRVPLVLWAPGVLPAGAAVAGQASLVDLRPTILGLLGVPDPEAEEIDGADLRPLIADPSAAGRPAYAEAVTPRIELGWSELRAVRAEGFKLIDGPRPELYDLRADPEETTDLFAASPRRAAAMRELLRTWTAGDDLARLSLGDGFVDREAARRLRSLGYGAGGAPAPPAAGAPAGPTQDPRERVADFEAFQDALRTVGRALEDADWRRAEEALAVMDRRIPGHHLFFYYRGRMSRLRGGAAAAVADLEHTVRLAPAHSLAYADLASAYRDLGEIEKAIEVLRPAAESFPENADVLFLLGSLLHESGRLDEALAAYLRVPSTEPSDPRLLGNLSHVHFLLGDYGAAAGLLQELVELEPSDPSHPYRLGLLEQRRNRPELAAEWFRRALAVDPGFAPAARELTQ